MGARPRLRHVAIGVEIRSTVAALPGHGGLF